MADNQKEKKLERIYIVNLSDAYECVRNKRAGGAVKILRHFMARHMKVDEKNVSISEGTNSLIWRDSIQKPPRKIKVRVVKDGEKAFVWLIGEQEENEKKKQEEKKKESKPKEQKKEAVKEEKKEAQKQQKDEAQKEQKSKEEAKKDKQLEKAIKDADKKA